MYKRGLAFLVGLLLATAYLTAFGADTVSVTDRNVQVTASIVGYTEDQLVGGTNESFQVLVSCQPVANTSGFPKWNSYWIEKIDVEIGGETITWTAPTGSHLTTQTLSFHWDTTHFNHETDLTIRCLAQVKLQRLGPSIAPNPPVVLESDLLLPEATQDITVYNKGFASDLPMFSGHLSETVAGYYEAMNYGCYTCAGVSQAQALLGARFCNAYFFYGHGAVFELTLGSSISVISDEAAPVWWIYDKPTSEPGYGDSYSANFRDQRIWSIDAGYPPMTFAFLATCHNGEDSAMATAFLSPYYSGLPSSVVDQAFLGWTKVSSTVWHEFLTPHVYAHLALKKTVVEARDHSFQLLWEWLDAHPEITDRPPSRSASGNLPIWGDAFTRMHGLYTGSSASAPDWYTVAAIY